jgi:hypothetical protein
LTPPSLPSSAGITSASSSAFTSRSSIAQAHLVLCCPSSLDFDTDRIL